MPGCFSSSSRIRTLASVCFCDTMCSAVNPPEEAFTENSLPACAISCWTLSTSWSLIATNHSSTPPLDAIKNNRKTKTKTNKQGKEKKNKPGSCFYSPQKKTANRKSWQNIFIL